jgi:hypothetical protein
VRSGLIAENARFSVNVQGKLFFRRDVAADSGCHVTARNRLRCCLGSRNLASMVREGGEPPEIAAQNLTPFSARPSIDCFLGWPKS